MKALDAVKTVATFMVSIGAGAIVGNAVKFTTPQAIGAISKLFVTVGSVALSYMVGDKTAEYTEKKIDDIAGMIDMNVEILPKIEEEQEETSKEGEA